MGSKDGEFSHAKQYLRLAARKPFKDSRTSGLDGKSKNYKPIKRIPLMWNTLKGQIVKIISSGAKQRHFTLKSEMMRKKKQKISQFIR